MFEASLSLESTSVWFAMHLLATNLCSHDAVITFHNYSSKLITA